MLLVLSASASAHTELSATSPANGATLGSTPPEVVVRYSAPLAGVVETSVSVDGKEGVGGVARLAATDAGRLRIPIPADHGGGVFTVRWVVRSADAHLLQGDLSFTVVRPSGRADLRHVAQRVLAAARGLRASVG